MIDQKVAIILINWNSYQVTSNCLQSLELIDYHNVEVIVVDNHSSDDSLFKLKREFPSACYIELNENLGFTGGSNEGLKRAREIGSDYYLLLNNDTVVQSDFLSELVKTISQDKSIGAIQPKIFFNHDRKLIWNAGGTFNQIWTVGRTIGEGKRDKKRYDKEGEIDWITGCAFLVRASVIEEIGLISDLYFYGGHDDVDWSLRIKKMGYKLIYCPSSIVYHEAGAAAKLEQKSKEGTLRPFFHYMANRNHWFLLRRHTKWYFYPTSILYQAIKLVGYSGYFIIRGRFRKLKAFLHGYCHGIVLPLEPKLLHHRRYLEIYK
jgi:GT2 family glycosyltransferase